MQCMWLGYGASAVAGPFLFGTGADLSDTRRERVRAAAVPAPARRPWSRQPQQPRSPTKSTPTGRSPLHPSACVGRDPAELPPGSPRVPAHPARALASAVAADAMHASSAALALAIDLARAGSRGSASGRPPVPKSADHQPQWKAHRASAALACCSPENRGALGHSPCRDPQRVPQR